MSYAELLMKNIFNGQSITKQEAIKLYNEPLTELCQTANEIRKYFCSNIFDICTIIGNLLNNAIEAYKEDFNNYEIRINLNGTKSVYQIEIANTIKESVLSGNKALKTSKSDTKNHGIGIKSVKSRAEKYNGKTQFTEENGQFVARVWLMA